MAIRFTRPNAPIVPPPTQIFLASQSVGRRMLLEKLGITFRVVISHVDEDKFTDKDPLKTLKIRAEAKLNEIVGHPRVYAVPEEGKSIIIAADSMAILGKKTYGKSLEREDAKEILKDLMGKTHVFATAIAIAYLEGHVEKKRVEKTVTTKVTMRKMTGPEVDSYVARYDFTRFAAAYALNETPWDLVTKVDGSYTNVVGLPFEVLLPILKKYEIIL
jgi:septum formation protein